jgi:hypothetical protein
MVLKTNIMTEDEIKHIQALIIRRSWDHLGDAIIAKWSDTYVKHFYSNSTVD